MEEEKGKEEGSDGLTTFAPFETDKSTSLAYKGDQAKLPQVEINDSSYLGQPKVLFRKLRSTTVTSRGTSSPRTSPQPAHAGTERPVPIRSASVASLASRKTPLPVGAAWRERSEREQSTRKASRDAGASLPVVKVTKTLVLNRIGSLEKKQVSSAALGGCVT